MDEKQLPGTALRDGSRDRTIEWDDRTPGFFEGCLLILRRGLRKILVLPGQSAGESKGHSSDLRSGAGVVHDSHGSNRRNAQRDLNIYFDYLDGLAPKYLAKKNGVTVSRIYQILKEMDKEGSRII